jgi:hypothetical protein
MAICVMAVVGAAPQPARGAFGVYRFGERAEAHALPFQAFQHTDQMRQRPPQPVEFPDGQHISRRKSL